MPRVHAQPPACRASQALSLARITTTSGDVSTPAGHSRRAEARRKHYRKSRLDRFRAELVAMRQAGASCADLAEWLRMRHCRVHRSSIDRYLKRLLEVPNAEVPCSASPG